MTREKEIRQEMSKIAGTHPDWSKNDCMRMGFLEGAKWADETMIEKACEWIKENIDIYAKVVINPKSHYPEIVMCNTFEKNFKKAMEL